MATATMTSKGQITIPKEIREALGIQAGDRIDFITETDGRVILKAATLEISALEGILYEKGRKPVSIEDMNRDIEKRFKRR